MQSKTLKTGLLKSDSSRYLLVTTIEFTQLSYFCLFVEVILKNFTIRENIRKLNWNYMILCKQSGPL